MLDVPARRTHLHAGAKNVVEYWAVPRANFPTGLPRAIADAEVSEDQLKQVKSMSGPELHFDHDGHFLIDCMIPRTSLGRGVFVVRFFVSVARPSEDPDQHSCNQSNP